MKSSFLVDTNVISESSRPNADPRVLKWLEDHDHQLFLSTISIGELSKGIALLQNGKRKQALESWFEEICQWAENRILVPDQMVMRTWGELCATCEKRGESLSVLDSMIAATALRYELTVVTRNCGDFPCEVSVLNPWDLSTGRSG